MKSRFFHRSVFGRFLRDEGGATAIEYGLIVSLIFLAAAGAINAYTDQTSIMYSEIASSL
jgi:pilus assembly protein Flp/PilA